MKGRLWRWVRLQLLGTEREKQQNKDYIRHEKISQERDQAHFPRSTSLVVSNQSRPLCIIHSTNMPELAEVWHRLLLKARKAMKDIRKPTNHCTRPGTLQQVQSNRVARPPRLQHNIAVLRTCQHMNLRSFNTDTLPQYTRA